MLASLGVPITEEILLSWSASSLPGNSGLPSSISARMQPARTRGCTNYVRQCIVTGTLHSPEGTLINMYT